MNKERFYDFEMVELRWFLNQADNAEDMVRRFRLLLETETKQEVSK